MIPRQTLLDTLRQALQALQALIRRSDPLLFREMELHGQGQTWFDRRGVLVEQHLDGPTDLAAAAARVPTLLASFEMFQHLLLKEIARGHASDALAFYQACTLRALAEALRPRAHGPGAGLAGAGPVPKDPIT